MTSTQCTGRVLLAALLVAVAPLTLAAQGNASAAAAAMGGNYTAVARNFNAIAWNPANLGLPGNSKFSLALSPQFGLGTGPITLQDLSDYSGVVVPLAVREAWLQKVDDNNGQTIGGDIDVTPLALSMGPIAISATSTMRANGALPTAMAELLFFGNAGRTGLPQDYALDDLALDVNLTTTVALAYGRKVGLVPVGTFSVGVTAKYIIGHAMASMRDNGSTITSDPVALVIDAPIVLTDTAEVMNNGTGFGVDVGAGWILGKLRLGAVVHNVMNTFAWNTDNLYYIPVNAAFDANGSSSAIDDLQPLSTAPAALQSVLRARIAEATPKPTISLGAAYSPMRMLTVAADFRTRLGDGLELGPNSQIGVGAELKLIPFIPLRAGVTSLTGGLRYSAGFGLELGIVNFQVSGALTDAEGRNDSAVGFTFGFGGR